MFLELNFNIFSSLFGGQHVTVRGLCHGGGVIEVLWAIGVVAALEASRSSFLRCNMLAEWGCFSSECSKGS